MNETGLIENIAMWPIYEQIKVKIIPCTRFRAPRQGPYFHFHPLKKYTDAQETETYPLSAHILGAHFWAWRWRVWHLNYSEILARWINLMALKLSRNQVYPSFKGQIPPKSFKLPLPAKSYSPSIFDKSNVPIKNTLKTLYYGYWKSFL